MDLFASMSAFGHEQLLVSHDPSCGYFGIIAIHDTTLGPALGGTRFWQYDSTEEALTDALRLARGMTCGPSAPRRGAQGLPMPSSSTPAP